MVEDDGGAVPGGSGGSAGGNRAAADNAESGKAGGGNFREYLCGLCAGGREPAAGAGECRAADADEADPGAEGSSAAGDEPCHPVHGG